MNVFEYARQLQQAHFNTFGEHLLGTVVLFGLLAVAGEAMENHDNWIWERRSPRTVLKRFAGFVVVFERRFWVDKPSARRMWAAKTAVIRSVKTAFDREEITVPFPQRTLTARAESGFDITDRGAPERTDSGEYPQESITVADGGKD